MGVVCLSNLVSVTSSLLEQQVQLEVDARFVLDQLHGDKTTEIRVKLIRRIKEVVAGDD